MGDRNLEILALFFDFCKNKKVKKEKIRYMLPMIDGNISILKLLPMKDLKEYFLKIYEGENVVDC